MCMGNVIVNGQSMPVREIKGHRVVTVADIANLHQTEKNNIQKNFLNNKKHFLIGTDYFNLKGKKAMENISIASSQVTQLNVFTESGYLMLAKSLTDDLSWQVQRELVNGYFRGMNQQSKPEGSRIVDMFPLLQEEFKHLLYYRVEKGMSQQETAKLLDCSEASVVRMEKKLKQAGIRIPPARRNGGKFQLTNYKAVSSLELEG